MLLNWFTFICLAMRLTLVIWRRCVSCHRTEYQEKQIVRNHSSIQNQPLITHTHTILYRVTWLLVFFLHENHDMMPLIVNSCKVDLDSRNSMFQALALSAIANLGGREMADALGATVIKLISGSTTKAFVVKRALLGAAASLPQESRRRHARQSQAAARATRAVARRRRADGRRQSAARRRQGQRRRVRVAALADRRRAAPHGRQEGVQEAVHVLRRAVAVAAGQAAALSPPLPGARRAGGVADRPVAQGDLRVAPTTTRPPRRASTTATRARRCCRRRLRSSCSSAASPSWCATP
jgi:hypothetical protein